MTDRSSPAILYISYDGMLEPLGQSQVLAYLEMLSDRYPIRLISFEKKEDWCRREEREAVRMRIEAAGIAWIPLRYHKTPTAPATAFDILAGAFVALYQVLRHRIAIVHARSYVAATMALLVKRVTGTKFLFDMRGFWADERIDAGLWPADSRLYRFAKRLEKRFLMAADHVVTLTQASAREIGTFPYLQGRKPAIAVIPTCADLDRFNRVGNARPTPFTFGFVGAAGTWSLFDQVLACFRQLIEVEPEARLLVVNRGEHAFIRERIGASGIDPERIELVTADHREMPLLLSRISAGAAVRRQAYSQIACAPTKLAEYLGCGIPCLANEGIGDVKAILEEAKVGIVLKDFSDEEVRSGMKALVALSREPDIAARCRTAAQRHFSLESGVAAYGEIYDRLAVSRRAGR
ncbi:glycosyltransferase [Sphingosinicella rhizophila]|uniref:Glycosyltransferase n=1 Tax=Sphingosinicella rhizophila TaxID=3050082 RepID=A0ABU3Q8G4_9SPHN|nr:glycosyltransferase [Sphingosinicella sp. GR2756]MDT9599692.1 glycosyltransferase [Sphingosinicella sp. GR2756]